MDPVKLYHLAPSHYCESARGILAFKGIPFETVNVPYGDHTEVLRVSGQDYVPIIDAGNGEHVLHADIADWAERVKPEPTIYPNGTRARCRVIESWAHGVVEDAAWKFAVADVPPRLQDGRERWVFVEMQELKRGPLELMKQRQPAFAKDLEHVCGLAEDLLGDKPFLLGDAPSLADFSVYGALHVLKFTGHDVPKRLERLAAWHARVDALTR